MPIGSFLEQSEDLEGLTDQLGGPAACARSTLGTSPTLSLQIGMDVFSVLGKGKNDFQDRTYWKKKIS